MCIDKTANISQDDCKEAVKIASDMVKILLNFAVGALALLIIFFRNDTFRSLSIIEKIIVIVTAVFLQVSIFSGVFSINRIYRRIEGRLKKESPEVRWSTDGIVAKSINFQAWCGILGIVGLSICLVFIGIPKS